MTIIVHHTFGTIPHYYIDMASHVECAFISDHMPGAICKAFEYVFREQGKNGKEDLIKAVNTLTKYLSNKQLSTIDLPQSAIDNWYKLYEVDKHPHLLILKELYLASVAPEECKIRNHIKVAIRLVREELNG